MTIIKGNGTPRTHNPADPFFGGESPKENTYYIDLDGTLAYYDTWGEKGEISDPIPLMKKQVLKWHKQGIKIKIFTARAYKEKNIKKIRKWLLLNGFPLFEITNIKEMDCSIIIDDKAREAIKNTGMIVDRTGELKKKDNFLFE